MTPGPRYPDFLCIGARKAGTTWLHHNLTRHPLVFTPPVKEVHYFDALYIEEARSLHRRAARQAESRNARAMANPVLAGVYRLGAALGIGPHTFPGRAFRIEAATATLDDAWYGGLFAGARDDQLACDFTPDYATLPEEGVRHAHRLNPAAKALLIVRNPVERAFSHAKWAAARKSKSFTEAELLRILDRPDVRRCDAYSDTIDRWTAAFGPERFKVMVFDDIARRPFGFLEEVCAFAGIPFRRSQFRDGGNRVNAGPAGAMPQAIRERLTRRYAGEIASLRRRLPAQTTGWDSAGADVARPDPSVEDLA